MASITSNTKVAFGGTAANLRSLFRGRKFLNKRATVGQAVPEIPLSEGSKSDFSELLAKFPYTSPYMYTVYIILPSFSTVCSNSVCGQESKKLSDEDFPDQMPCGISAG